MSIDPEMVFRYLDVDLVIQGEGEDKVEGVMELAAGRCRPEDVPGAAFRSGDGVFMNPTSPCPSMGRLPTPCPEGHRQRKHKGCQRLH